MEHELRNTTQVEVFESEKLSIRAQSCSQVLSGSPSRPAGLDKEVSWVYKTKPSTALTNELSTGANVSGYVCTNPYWTYLFQIAQRFSFKILM